jgi:hypothetical protein
MFPGMRFDPDFKCFCEGLEIRRQAAAAQSVEQPQLPWLGQQAVNFVGSMVAVASGVIAGQGVWVTQEQFDKRMEQCHVCEFWVKDQKRCLLCGCRQEKLWLKAVRCPDKPPRWLEETEPAAPPSEEPGPQI